MAQDPDRPRETFDVRIHGRGGQGVVTAAELLAQAAFLDGRWARAFPSFGSERSGAPVAAFCRIAGHEVRTREPVTEPNGLIVLDPTLLHQVDVFSGLAPDGYLLVNTARGFEELGLTEFVARFRRERLATVPATDLARRYVGRPVPNVVSLAGFAALTGLVSLDGLLAAVRAHFRGRVAKDNSAAARAAYRLVAGADTEAAHAATG